MTDIQNINDPNFIQLLIFHVIFPIINYIFISIYYLLLLSIFIIIFINILQSKQSNDNNILQNKEQIIEEMTNTGRIYYDTIIVKLANNTI